MTASAGPTSPSILYHSSKILVSYNPPVGIGATSLSDMCTLTSLVTPAPEPPLSVREPETCAIAVALGVATALDPPSENIGGLVGAAVSVVVDGDPETAMEPRPRDMSDDGVTAGGGAAGEVRAVAGVVLVLDSALGGTTAIELNPKATLGVVLIWLCMLDVGDEESDAGGTEATVTRVEPGDPAAVRVPPNPPKAPGPEAAVALLKPAVTAF